MMGVLSVTAVGSLFFHGFCLSLFEACWTFSTCTILWRGSSVYLFMVQRSICGCNARTSSLALACCLDFPQTCFITANLSGSHWALGWPLVPRPALLVYQGTASLSVRTLPRSPPAAEQPWLCPGSVPLRLFWTSCVLVPLDTLRFCLGKESDQSIHLYRILQT